jgi:hypothetical protein
MRESRGMRIDGGLRWRDGTLVGPSLDRLGAGRALSVKETNSNGHGGA